jgi:hypothetical protein
MTSSVEKMKKIKIDDFYVIGTPGFALGFVFNMLLLFLIVLFTAFFQYSSIYLPKLFNYPFSSTVITLGLYTTACIRKDRQWMLAVAASSTLAFVTTAFYLNELTNSEGGVSVTDRFTGTFSYAMINPTKSLRITNSKRESLEADIYIYSGLIFTVSYAVFVNFMHWVFSLRYIFTRHYEIVDDTNTKNTASKLSTATGSSYGFNGAKPGDTMRIVGYAFACINIFIGCAQSIIAMSFIGVIVPSFFPDTMPLTLFVCFIALSPPSILHTSSHTVAEVQSLVHGNRRHTATESQPATEYTPTNHIPFAIYLTFLVLGCFYTIANYVIDASWRGYNDLAIFCDSNSTHFFAKGFEYLIQNESYAGETVTYNTDSEFVVTYTLGLYCFDSVMSFLMVIFMLITTLSHFAMLKYLCDKH